MQSQLQRQAVKPDLLLPWLLLSLRRLREPGFQDKESLRARALQPDCLKTALALGSWCLWQIT